MINSIDIIAIALNRVTPYKALTLSAVALVSETPTKNITIRFSTDVIYGDSRLDYINETFFVYFILA